MNAGKCQAILVAQMAYVGFETALARTQENWGGVRIPSSSV